MFSKLLESYNITDEQFQKLDESGRRKIKAQIIIENPRLFKECSACCSLVYFEVPVCFICNNYQFETDNESVIKQARELLSGKERTTITDYT